MPGKSLENMHVAVLAGGHSAEREISLIREKTSWWP